ncbi:hypothetical protein DP939_44740 [Spongiactinospora rosea]|uniref:Uncharacterized protein n=1 Tax=Spongiactinospora rosea TaxID=2248750 RepID=A0A366LCR2_9ACTN|nr:hypothetical protein [Spongiactinospora rosea]RBQ11675.1 hypothetical protein DP939_44740 [Spongiactinospora rosea]
MRLTGAAGEFGSRLRLETGHRRTQAASDRESFFFTKAARTLAALGAPRHYRHGIRTRGTTFRLTQADLEEGCTTKSTALETIEGGVHSARARQTITDTRTLVPLPPRRTPRHLRARGPIADVAADQRL